jgi:hypothetical protein
MRFWSFMIIVTISFVVSACSASMFMVGKGETRGRFLGSNSKNLYEMLCTSGDMEKILAATHFDQEMKDAFYGANCLDGRSSDKVKQLYVSMTPAQRKDIRTAFKANGYSVNGGSC